MRRQPSGMRIPKGVHKVCPAAHPVRQRAASLIRPSFDLPFDDGVPRPPLPQRACARPSGALAPRQGAFFFREAAQGSCSRSQSLAQKREQPVRSW